MLRKVFRGMLIGCVLGSVSLVAVGESAAFFGLFQRKYDAAAAMYGGTVCNPCGQQLVCNYVPQTCYRVQYVTVPTVTYRPVTSCDPCTGCQTTCMRPATCYTQQARYVPYTTYRLVYSAAQPACPTATTSYYAAPVTYAAPTAAAPAASVIPTALSGCSSCGSGRAATTYYAPGASYQAPATSYSYAAPAANTPSYYGVPAAVMPTTPPMGGVIVNNGSAVAAPSMASPNMPTPAPALGSSGSSPGGVQTYEKKVDPQSTDAMKPIPDPQISTPQGPKLELGPTSSPRLYDPQDKTAIAWPVERAWSYSAVGSNDWPPAATPVSAVVERQPILQAAVLETPVASPAATLGPIVAPQPVVDADGWQAAGR